MPRVSPQWSGWRLETRRKAPAADGCTQDLRPAPFVSISARKAPIACAASMSTSGSRPPGQPQRKMVLRRKVVTEQGSQATASLAPKDVAPQTLPPPPTLLPRVHRPIEHPADLDTPAKPATRGDSGVDWHSSSGSKAAALLTSRSGATPVPLPSRISVPPVVASVPIGALQQPIEQKSPRGQRLLVVAGLAVAGALVAGAVVVGMRLQIHPTNVATSPVEVPHAASPQSVPSPAQPFDTHADHVTSVEDLPRAPVPARPPAAAMPHSLHVPIVAASAIAKPGTEAPPEEAAGVAAASASAGPSASGVPESASAPVPEVDLPSAPPPPADPLIRAVQQSIDDGTRH